MADTYTYYLDGEQIHPLNAIGYKYVKEGNYRFKRKKLRGAVVMPFAVYDLLIDDISAKHTFTVKKNDSEDWQGTFYYTDCTIDEETKTVEVEPLVVDAYTDFLKLASEKNDCLLLNVSTVNIPYKTFLDFEISFSTSSAALAARGFTEVALGYYGDGLNVYCYARESCAMQVDSNFSWIENDGFFAKQFEHSYTTTNEADKIQVDVGYIYGNVPTGNTEVCSYGDARFYIADEQQTTIVDSRPFRARRVEFFLSEIVQSFGLFFSSHLLFDTTSPVTGLPNPLRDAFIIDMSDFKRPAAETGATINEQSLLNILNDLAILFNAEFWIANSKYVCFEHVSYQKTALGTTDLTAYETNRKKGFDKQAAPWKERFPAAGDNSEDATAYRENLGNVTDEIAETPASIIATDVQAIWDEPSAFDENLLVLYTTVEGTGLISGETVPNAPLLTANRMHDYYRHECPTPMFDINGTQYGAYSVKRTMQQNDFELFLGNDFDPYLFVETELGTGWLTAAEHEHETGWWKLSAAYDPYSANIFGL